MLARRLLLTHCLWGLSWALLMCVPMKSVTAIEPADAKLLAQILSSPANVDRAALIAQVSDRALRSQLTAARVEIDQAAATRRRTEQFALDVEQAHGKIEYAPGGPEWLRAAAGGEALKLFETPNVVSLNDGNNPLKGQGKLNTTINDAWLERLSGLTSITALDLSNCDVHHSGLRQVATLTRLQSLSLTLSSVVDDDLAPLAGLTDLNRLSLASTHTTGEGFRQLTALRQLSNLNMHHALTNDAGLAEIAKVGNLERLWIAHTHFTDAAAPSLAAHKNLKRLGIGSTSKASSGKVLAGIVDLPLAELELFDNQATGEGVAFAARVKTLRILNIAYGPTVDDAALVEFTKLPQLEDLKLGGTKVTDAGLAQLAQIKSLRKLNLSRSKTITDTELEKIRAARPKLMIEVK